jgi:hypothetical protein
MEFFAIFATAFKYEREDVTLFGPRQASLGAPKERLTFPTNGGRGTRIVN